MATWTRLLLLVAMMAAVLGGPLLAVAPLSTACGTANSLGGCTACAPGDAPCCIACSGAEKSCCRHASNPESTADPDSGCGSCPLGQCDCCQTLQSLTLVYLPSGGLASSPRLLVVPLLTTDLLLISRSDEPLLPPPIA